MYVSHFYQIKPKNCIVGITVKILFSLENDVDPDQLATDEAS